MPKIKSCVSFKVCAAKHNKSKMGSENKCSLTSQTQQTSKRLDRSERTQKWMWVLEGETCHKDEKSELGEYLLIKSGACSTLVSLHIHNIYLCAHSSLLLTRHCYSTVTGRVVFVKKINLRYSLLLPSLQSDERREMKQNKMHSREVEIQYMHLPFRLNSVHWLEQNGGIISDMGKYLFQKWRA